MIPGVEPAAAVEKPTGIRLQDTVSGTGAFAPAAERKPVLLAPLGYAADDLPRQRTRVLPVAQDLLPVDENVQDPFREAVRVYRADDPVVLERAEIAAVPRGCHLEIAVDQELPARQRERGHLDRPSRRERHGRVEGPGLTRDLAPIERRVELFRSPC